jgi:hypothetical protein
MEVEVDQPEEEQGLDPMDPDIPTPVYFPQATEPDPLPPRKSRHKDDPARVPARKARPERKREDPAKRSARWVPEGLSERDLESLMIGQLMQTGRYEVRALKRGPFRQQNWKRHVDARAAVPAPAPVASPAEAAGSRRRKQQKKRCRWMRKDQQRQHQQDAGGP